MTTIDKEAFYECSSLTSITVPTTVSATTIGIKAFYGCSSLTSIKFGKNLTSLGYNAIEGCTKLKTIYFQSSTPPSVSGNWSDNLLYFSGPINAIVYVPKGTSTDYQKALRLDFWPLAVREFGEVINKPMTIHVDKAGTLSELLDSETARNLTDIILTGELNYDDFRYLRIWAISVYDKIEDGETKYDYTQGEGILRKITLKDVKLIDDGKTGSIYGYGADESGRYGAFNLGVDASIGTEGKTIQALFACLYGVEEITIPTGVTTIGAASFWNDACLISVELPSSVTDILDEAFSYCFSLKSIYCHMAVPANVSDDSVFEGVDKENCTLYVPIGSAEAYRAAEYWKEFKNIVEYKYKYDDPTGIDKVTTDSNNQGDTHEVARYSINGQRLNAPTKGINIVKYSDGTTKKVMVP